MVCNYAGAPFLAGHQTRVAIIRNSAAGFFECNQTRVPAASFSRRPLSRAKRINHARRRRGRGAGKKSGRAARRPSLLTGCPCRESGGRSPAIIRVQTERCSPGRGVKSADFEWADTKRARGPLNSSVFVAKVALPTNDRCVAATAHGDEIQSERLSQSD